MKIIKILIAVILIFTLTFSLTACGKPTDDNKQESNVALNDTTVMQNQDNTIQDTAFETVFISQPDSTTTPVSSTPATQATEVQTQNNSVPANNNSTNPAPKPTQVQQTPTEKPTVKPESNESADSSGVNTYSADYNGITHTVFYPADAENKNVRYPVIVFANGTGFSYTIYENLLREMAKGGYIVIANSETMAADGTAQSCSLDFIISENSNSSSVLYKNVITDKVAAAGHSQGGRSAVNAAAADSRFDCVVSLAGSNFTEEAEKLKAPALFLAGTKDMIVDANRWVKPAYEVCKGPAVYASLVNGIHTSCCTSPATYTNYVMKWCNYWLKNDASGKGAFVNGGELSNDSAWTEFNCKGL